MCLVGHRLSLKANFANKRKIEKDPFYADQCSGKLPTTYNLPLTFHSCVIGWEKSPPILQLKSLLSTSGAVGARWMNSWGNRCPAPLFGQLPVTLAEGLPATLGMLLWPEPLRGILLSVQEVSRGCQLSGCAWKNHPEVPNPQALERLWGCASNQWPSSIFNQKDHKKDGLGSLLLKKELCLLLL